MIDAVFLDVGGVLLLPDHGVVSSTLRAVGHDVDPGLLDGAHYHGSAALADWPEARQGTHLDAAIYERFNRAYVAALGVHDRLANVAREALAVAFGRFDMWRRPAPGAAEGMAALASTGAALAVVSNANGEIEQALREQGICHVGPGEGTCVDAVVDSTVVGFAKPDPRIFHLALEAVGVPPERAVHVGDIVGADVVGARAAGVRPLHFDPYGLCAGEDHDHVASLLEVAGLVREARTTHASRGPTW